MMTLTSSNYHSPAANSEYWSVSLFKAFDKCEAAGLAQVRGQYEREETDALLIGSYVDAYFTGDIDEFVGEHADVMFKKNGELYAKYEHANKVINTVECQPLMMEYLTGEHQKIFTADLFGVPWKIKTDVYSGPLMDKNETESRGRIVDLKCVKDFKPIYEEGFGYRSWIEYWGYDIQGAVYQKVVEQATGERLPFYIVAVTKEKVPDVAVIEIPQHVLDTALKVVEAKIDRFDLVKTGEIPPERCGKCEWCKQTKILTVPSVYGDDEETVTFVADGIPYHTFKVKGEN